MMVDDLSRYPGQVLIRGYQKVRLRSYYLAHCYNQRGSFYVKFVLRVNYEFAISLVIVPLDMGWIIPIYQGEDISNETLV